jgi:hypothetical protein
MEVPEDIGLQKINSLCFRLLEDMWPFGVMSTRVMNASTNQNLTLPIEKKTSSIKLSRVIEEKGTVGTYSDMGRNLR